MPLSDKGFRSTIGQHEGMFGVKSSAYVTVDSCMDMAQLLIGFSDNPYRLFESLYKTGMKVLGREENLVENKDFPKPLDYLGWCTWNSLDMGVRQDSTHIVDGVKSFLAKGLRIGWVIIDNGWEDSEKKQLPTYSPNQRQFPDGFAPMNRFLKDSLGVRFMGIWNALNGNWKGLEPGSELWKKYAEVLMYWEETDAVSGTRDTSYFIRPDAKEELEAFYDDWIHYEQQQGFDFVKNR